MVSKAQGKITLISVRQAKRFSTEAAAAAAMTAPACSACSATAGVPTRITASVSAPLMFLCNLRNCVLTSPPIGGD